MQTNCVNCGAPLTYEGCTYCGTLNNWNAPNIQQITKNKLGIGEFLVPEELRVINHIQLLMNELINEKKHENKEI